jgi:hypothetical protein
MKIEIDLVALKSLKLTSNEYIYIQLLVQNPSLATEFRSFKYGITQDELNKLIEVGYINQDYSLTTNAITKFKVKSDYFEAFFDEYPVAVIGPDGNKRYLRLHTNNCKTLYKKIVGNDQELHKHIVECLKYQLSKQKLKDLTYMRTMYNWLKNEEWKQWEENQQEEIVKTQKIKEAYGNTIL